MGPVGPRGPRGPIGPAGPTGATGATGATGTTALLAYGNFASVTEQQLEAPAVVALNVVANASENIQLNGSSPAVTILEAGVYFVQYGISYTVGATGVLELRQNGAPVPNSQITALSAAGQESGSVILTLAQNDTLDIGIADGSFSLPGGDVNATLTLIRLA